MQGLAVVGFCRHEGVRSFFGCDRLIIDCRSMNNCRFHGQNSTVVIVRTSCYCKSDIVALSISRFLPLCWENSNFQVLNLSLFCQTTCAAITNSSSLHIIFCKKSFHCNHLSVFHSRCGRLLSNHYGNRRNQLIERVFWALESDWRVQIETRRGPNHCKGGPMLETKIGT